MIELTTPFGLWALTALGVPVIIHLVRRPLRVVRVASLRFVAAERVSVRLPRWRDVWLLVLRCAILALLALVLAGISWQEARKKPVQWALLTPNARLDPSVQQAWRALAEDGYESRLLATGFPPLSQEGKSVGDSVDAWSLLRELDARVAAGSRVVVFGPTSAEMFRGPRPTLSRLEVSWHATPEHAMKAGEVALPKVRVAIFAAADRADDARYLRAALQAIDGVTESAEAPHWIFQLGNAAVPERLIQRGSILVTDAPNEAQSVSVRRSFDVGSSLVRLRQRTPEPEGAALLVDSAGQALITRERAGGGARWRLALRLHPDWSDWTTSSAFPAWWREQLRPSAPVLPPIPVDVATPRFVPENEPGAPPLAPWDPIDLRLWCWLLAVLAFAAERVLNARRQDRSVRA